MILSDKIFPVTRDFDRDVIDAKDVREFIKELKEQIRFRSNIDIIDKLAGEKLI